MSNLRNKLIAKEFYLHRWMIAGSTAAGIAGLLIAAEGAMRFNIGMLIWLTTIIGFGVILVMLGIASERKERALQLVLSLPLSPRDYVRVKHVAPVLCFLVPWTVLSAGAVILIAVMPNLPDGLLVFAVLMCVFLLANFSVVLCGGLHTASEGAMSTVIIITNMAVTLFIFLVGALPALNDQLRAPAPDWNSTFWTVLAVEIAVLLITLSLPYFVASRRRDFL
jgi:ABC-type transport system involved in multi-copper enzyme maturation permease subunit